MLAEGNDVMDVRADFLDSFKDALGPVGLLDRFKVSGVIAEWWDALQNDFRALAAQGFGGLIDSWVISIQDAENRSDKEAPDPFDHKCVPYLLSDYLDEMESAEQTLSNVEEKKEAFESGNPPDDDPVDEDWADDLGSGPDRYDHFLRDHIQDLEAAKQKNPSEAADLHARIKHCKRQLEQYDAIKREVVDAKKAIKKLRTQLLDRLHETRESLTDEEEKTLVLDVVHAELEQELSGYVDAHRQRVVAAFETWWDKYHTTMQDIKSRREQTTAKLDDYLDQMGYV
jgi:type I restriction enzyme M protein